MWSKDWSLVYEHRVSYGLEKVLPNNMKLLIHFLKNIVNQNARSRKAAATFEAL